MKRRTARMHKMFTLVKFRMFQIPDIKSISITTYNHVINDRLPINFLHRFVCFDIYIILQFLRSSIETSTDACKNKEGFHFLHLFACFDNTIGVISSCTSLFAFIKISRKALNKSSDVIFWIFFRA